MNPRLQVGPPCITPACWSSRAPLLASSFPSGGSTAPRCAGLAERLKRLGSISLGVAWAALVLLLPITSFPLVSRLAGGTMVAPASLLPLGWLILAWFGFYLVKKGSLPRETIPFL